MMNKKSNSNIVPITVFFLVLIMAPSISCKYYKAYTDYVAQGLMVISITVDGDGDAYEWDLSGNVTSCVEIANNDFSWTCTLGQGVYLSTQDDGNASITIQIQMGN